MENYITLLKNKYSGAAKRPKSLNELMAENPDIPFDLVNAYIKKKHRERVEKFYIKQRIIHRHDTDLQEWIFCKVNVLKYPYDNKERIKYYICPNDDYHVGDSVLVYFGSGKEAAVILEIIHCLGVDSPKPVWDTYEVLQKVGIPDWAKGITESSKYDFFKLDTFDINKYEETAPVWTDESKLAAYGTNKSMQQELLAKFQGLALDIKELAEYLDTFKNIHNLYNIQVLEKGCCELNIPRIPFDMNLNVAQLVKKHPALKATGWRECWSSGIVEVWYSESGYGYETDVFEAGEFDPGHEDGDGRWAQYYDIMDEVSVRFTSLKTSERCIVNYRYPFEEKWNGDNYLIKRNGKWYKK